MQILFHLTRYNFISVFTIQFHNYDSNRSLCQSVDNKLVTAQWRHLYDKGQMSPKWTMFANWILSAYLNLFDLG